MSKSPQPSAELPAAAVPADSSSSSTSAQHMPYYGTPPLQHAFAVGAAILAPIGLVLPPRRLGVRSLLFATSFFFATSQLAYDYTGQSIYQRFQRRANQFNELQSQDLPPAAIERQKAMRAERERRRQLLEGTATTGAAGGAAGSAAANPKEDWVVERARKERETLESGGGYWDLIMNQIGEVATDLMGKDKKPEEGQAAPATPTPTKSENSSK
ncbi:hypothetical protein Sste5346_008897 [Sporothrix stenoceras]|uniref:Uncharacterized protein n=1 Tax=Sporothrix stenoceras TaxID=5173 RepID=A0ABR3YPV3_9PEZI